jgi:hypothetical protein
MFPTRKRFMLLHLSGKGIRSMANHPFFAQGKRWSEAVDLRPGDPLLSHDVEYVAVVGISDSGEQEVMGHLNLGEPPMPDQTPPNNTNRCIIGFVAGTPLLTPENLKRIEDIKSGDVIQTQPDDNQGDQKPDPQDDDHAHDEHRWWESN